MSQFQKRVKFLINFSSKKTLNENLFLLEDSLTGEPKSQVYNFTPKQFSVQDKTYQKKPIVLPKKQNTPQLFSSTINVDNSDENPLLSYDLYLEPKPPIQVEDTIQSPGIEPEVAYMLPYDSNRAKIEICEKNKFPIQYSWLKPPSKYNFYQGEGKKIFAGCSCGGSYQRPKYLYKDMDETNPTYGKFLSKNLNKMDLWLDPETNPLPDSERKKISKVSNLELIYLQQLEKDTQNLEILSKLEKIKGDEWCFGKSGREFLNKIYLLDLEDWKKNYKRTQDFQQLIFRVSLLLGGFEFLLGGTIAKSIILYTGLDVTLVVNKISSAKEQENELLKNLEYIEAGIFVAFGVLSLSIFGLQLLSKYGITKNLVNKLMTPFVDSKISRLKQTLELARIFKDGDFIPYMTSNIFFENTISLLKNSKFLRTKLWVALKFRQILSISKITIAVYFGGKKILCTVTEIGAWIGLKGYELENKGELKNIPKTQKNAYNILKSTNEQLGPKLEKQLEEEKNNPENIKMLEHITETNKKIEFVKKLEEYMKRLSDSLRNEIDKEIQSMPSDSLNTSDKNKIDYVQKTDSIL